MTDGTSTDWLTDRILRGLFGAAKLLPYGPRGRVMSAATRRVIGPLAGYRRRALDNLAFVWPELDPGARRRIARQVLDNMGRTLIENYSASDLAQHLGQTEATGLGLTAIAEAKAAGRPVLFVTGHFGNYEAPRHVLTRMGYTIGGLYKPMSNPYFNAHYARTMEGISGPLFETGHKGTMGFARHLKRGGMATMLFDVADSSAENLPFLERPARTSRAAATIALRCNALLVPYFGTRRGGTGFEIDVEAPIAETNPEQMTRDMTARLEARVLKDPGQWFWVHRRWKQPGSAH